MTGLLKAIAQAARLGRPPRKPDSLWNENIPIPHDHPLVPSQIQNDVREYKNVGCDLHRVQTPEGIEWWLFDAAGELIEVFWLHE